jgi:hypothetical protein
MNERCPVCYHQLAQFKQTGRSMSVEQKISNILAVDNLALPEEHVTLLNLIRKYFT